MVIGELIAQGDLKGLSSAGVALDLDKPVTHSAKSLSDGIGLGHVVLHEPRVVVTNLFNEDTDAETERLNTAVRGLRVTIDDMLARREVAFEGEHREILETYRMFAHDKGWVRRMEDAIRNGLTAEAGVEKVQSDMRAKMSSVTDPYLRERLSDFDDLANRLLRQLVGRNTGGDGALPNDAILLARSMGAAELLDYPRENLRGLVLEDGAPTSHVVIVARAMGIPVIGQAKGIVAVSENDDAIIVDGQTGDVHLRPQLDVQSAYAEKVKFRAKRQEEFKELRGKPSITKDGQQFSLHMNAGLLVDVSQLAESGADGIGLFRTELQFMIASTFPRADAQEKLYRSVIDEAGGKPITFRTLDIGGDKVLPYFRNAPQEENPALGWRAIRLALDRPGLFRTQIRALLRASAGHELKLMVPMVSEILEIDQARELIDNEVRHLSKFGHGLPKKIQIGTMLEVPSLLFDLDNLMRKADFVSIGSNDLFQFFYAADRALTLCGEIAGRPITALAIRALGISYSSMSPAAIGPVKDALLKADIGLLSAELLPALADTEHPTCLRTLIEDFAERHDITL
ncbi:Phosphoenolpyruvate-protein phosphotransferase [Nymphon striatum]|nr:Phosphoenolpyruvate-protein phosphotransferase [Nymphon striatum]